MENEGFEPDPRKNYDIFTIDEFGPKNNISSNSLNNSLKKEDEGELSEFEDDERLGQSSNFLSKIVTATRTSIFNMIIHNKKTAKIGLYAIIAALYFGYLGIAIIHNSKNEIKVDWCDGLGMLIIITGLTIWSLFYYFILKKYGGKLVNNKILKPLKRKMGPILSLWYIKLSLAVIILGGLAVFLYFDTKGEEERLISAGGLLVIVFIGLLISKHPGHVIWSQVLWGLGIQFCMGLIVLRWRAGQCIFECLSAKAEKFLDYTNVGSSFVYGYLATGYNSNDTRTSEAENGFFSFQLDPVFVFKNLSVIFFFSFFIQLLYHYGIMQFVVEKVGWLLQISIGTTAAESMNAAANIFIGQTEAPILIKPFLGKMTNSELHAVMTGGFATIAGAVMAAYIAMGVKPTYLLSASVMAAPAGLALSKLIYPETKISKTTSKDIKFMESIKTEGNALDAAAQGASQGVQLIGNILANIIAFMAFIAFLDAVIGWLGYLAGSDELSFQWILGKIFVPVAYMIGIDADDVESVGKLLGLKTVVNEFVAYQQLKIIESTLKVRSVAITTYALCSFANISSIGIQLGGLSFMAPERRGDISNTIFRAFIAGSLAGLLNACIAGTLLSTSAALKDDSCFS